MSEKPTLIKNARFEGGSIPRWARVPIRECGEPLVELPNSLWVRPWYYELGFSLTDKMYLRQGVAEQLIRVQKKLMRGRSPRRFLIYDGYRPKEVQIALYEEFFNNLKREHPDWPNRKLQTETRKFYNPGSDTRIVPPHSTGGTVDLTLVDADGKELDMGTKVDTPVPESAPLYYEGAVPAGFDEDSWLLIRDNRRWLREPLEAVGFEFWPTEWWHADLGTQPEVFAYNKKCTSAKQKKKYAIYGEMPPPDGK